LLSAVASTSALVAETGSRLRKTEAIAALLGTCTPEEVRVVVAYLSGEVPGGTVGVGWASLRDVPPPAATASLRLLEAQALIDRIRSATGQGSQAARRGMLRGLFAAATEGEQRFLRALLVGELRQGALEGVMAEAVARAGEVPAAAVRRAAMLSGDLAEVAAAVVADGEAGLGRFRLRVLRPVKPMLAKTADSLEEALDRTGTASVEWKLDGARVQVHRDGGEVRVFTRSLADVTGRVAEIVAEALSLPARTLILDGEAIALRRDGRPHPFQVTMSRFGTRPTRGPAPPTGLSPFFFDVLHLDGDDLIDLPVRERRVRLESAVLPAMRIPHVDAERPEGARALLDSALESGHEGVMVKSLETSYEAGRRGAGWLKVKPAHTLDLIILAAEWGHGRRRGWLSNLHLGARDPRAGGFVMLGKTFKGLTDEMLRWQTERLLELEVSRDEYTVYVRPHVVVEVAFDGVQTSRRYPGGMALRFARVKGYRPDKRPEEADTVDAVRAIGRAS
jgi:DNA ligase-1